MREKLLTVVVPTYNTEKLLPRCLDSLIVEKFLPLLEVLIVIDGSPDNSVAVAGKYAERYPDTFIVVEKENGGHGSTINKGIELATGKYFKVLDSDDWFDKQAFTDFLEKLQNIDVDVVLTDYVREYVFENRQELMPLQENEGNVYNVITDLNSFAMARQTFKLELIKKSNLKLPEKMFYVDTIYAKIPCLYAQSFKYYKLPVYRYYIGREGQSVSMVGSIKNREHYKYVFQFLYKKEKEITGQLVDVVGFTILNEHILSVLSHLQYDLAKEELNQWNTFLKTAIEEPEIKQGKLYKLYNALPFWLYKNLFDLYKKIKPSK
ncbi:glycosyltransferase family 2 protein [Capnocytophaga sp.]|uniref:glycosyltransferase family 2 protein n=1 Tax=Capnocytophaga sp. TaxID=44737 RepID=UPI0026DAB415|nr:glycosyltransferase family 2 protein [Capnocytophaga sp.]MDO5104292.1 glycosyltransferase family 2 protein [Capnocytophaga sp.]